MRIAIHHEGKYGSIRYNEGNHEVMVAHPDERVRNTVRHYLTNERTFIMPSDDDVNKRGNRMPVNMTPTDSKMAIELALCEMFHNTGVHVDWGHDDNFGSTSPDDMFVDTSSDPNEKADKPIKKPKIIKSLFDDEDYEIIE